MEPEQPLNNDLRLIDRNIHKLWNQISSRPTAADIENNEYLNNEQAMTSRNEIFGWIIYDFANSPQWQVFSALAWTLFVTGNATQYACTNYLEYGCDINNNPINTDKDVRIKLGGDRGWELRPESFFFFVISMSGIIQLISYIIFGGLMDFNYYQYYIFRICTICTVLFDLPYIFLSDSSSFMFAAWWTSISFVIYGISSIAYNAHLVDIVENHWLIRRAISMNVDNNDIIRIRKIIVDDISNFGIACGYLGSLFMTIIAILIFILITDKRYTEMNGYGVITDNMFNEMYAKNVYGVKINYFYNNTNTQISSIQLFYDDINLNGSIIGENSNDNIELFRSDDVINKIYLWYNNDQTIATMQFETISNIKSNIFGSNTTKNQDAKIIYVDKFVLGGYNVYIDNIIISGFDFLFISPHGQYSSTLAIRVVILSVFIWWFTWQLITIFTMKKRRKPKLPSNSNIFTISGKNTWSVLTETFKKYKHIRYAMISWFFYSDALVTATNSAILFASIELNFTSLELTLIVLEYEICSAIGGIFHVWMSKKLNWDCRKMTIYHLCFYTVLMSLPLIGLIPNMPFGLVNKWEVWIYGFLFGINIGSIFGYSRALLINLIPIGKENELFSLFAITDKGSSWIGPLITGLLSNAFGLRWSLIYIVIFFIISLLFIIKIDLEKGMKDCGRLNIEESNKNQSESVQNTNCEINQNVVTELQQYLE